MKQVLGYFCTPPTFFPLWCAQQCGGQESGFGGHRVTAQLDPATSPSCFYLFLVKHGNSPVFLERQPLPPQFQVICRMPSAWGRDSPGPGLGDKWGGCPMEAKQHLWVWSSSNK